MNKRNHSSYEAGPTPLDESWWAAVLAEENNHGEGFSHRNSSQVKVEKHNSNPHPHPIPRSGTVDWTQAQQIYGQDEAICLQVVGYNRGGLLVEGNGLQGFVPLSHLVELTPDVGDGEYENHNLSPVLAAYISRSLRLKIIECDPERGRVVFSERAALAAPGRRNELLDSLRQGDCVRGIVTNITDFGVFVDLGGVEGLIHVSELSWGRVRHPSDAAEVGDDLQAYVIQVDKERSRVALSLKRLRANPWDSVSARYHIGQEAEAVVTSVVPFGAFARLEEGLDGLIHVSEMAAHGEKVNPNNYLKEGQHIVVRILHVDSTKQRLGLSLVYKRD